MMRRTVLLMIAATALAAPLHAQLGGLGLPQTGLPGLPDPTGAVGSVLDGADTAVRAQAQRLLDLRQRMLARLVRQNRDTIELDRAGAPARRGELLVMDADAAGLARARAAGFAVIGSDQVAGLDLAVTRISVPQGLSLARAQDRLEALLPEASVSADTLHFTAGARGSGGAEASPKAGVAIETPVGVIDGGPGSGVALAGSRGFAKGAPRPSDHATALISLLGAAGVRTVRLADVYGTDPAGGNALAIARALGWLVEEGSQVVSISLVGPSNPVLARAVASAQKRGVVIVAPVGNDGPAAPPAYPASYAGVVSVTAVDRRDRALIEAGRALHLDYAAPGADLIARSAAGKSMRVRGTSYAVPLVAARLAAALARPGAWQARLDAEARDLGQRGTDPVYGRGLVCGACRPAR